MKRLIPVSIILIVVIALTLCSNVMIDNATAQMIDTLKEAHIYNECGDYESAKQKLDDFYETFERYETLFIFFVRRDLVSNVYTTASSLYEYANEETKNDFNADVVKTIQQLEIIRRHILRLA